MNDVPVSPTDPVDPVVIRCTSQNGFIQETPFSFYLAVTEHSLTWAGIMSSVFLESKKVPGALPIGKKFAESGS